MKNKVYDGIKLNKLSFSFACRSDTWSRSNLQNATEVSDTVKPLNNGHSK